MDFKYNKDDKRRKEILGLSDISNNRDIIYNDFNDTNNICMCETCKYNRELNLKDNNVRCAAKSYLASWRHLRRRKCKHYKKLLN